MTTYRLDRAPALAVAGGAIVVAAAAAFVGFLASWAWLGVVAVLALVVAALVLWRPPVVVRLDEHGIRTRRARELWTDVEDASVTGNELRLTLGPEGPTQRVLRLPLTSIGGRAPELVRETYDRLNTANGYRRFQ